MAGLSVLCLLSLALQATAGVIPRDQQAERRQECEKTSVVILGAGIAGITTAQALANHSITDFLIIEHQDEIGGRVHHANFGQGSDGRPLVVEYGANWAQGLGTPGGPENPIWTFEKKWNIDNHPSNGSRLLTYGQNGSADFASEVDEFEDAFSRMLAEAGEVLSQNLQDRTVREGLSLVDWKPSQRKDPAAADAVEWWLYDGEQAVTPDESSLVFNAAVNNFTFLQFSEENNFVIDQRGHNTWVKGEASEYLTDNDPRLRLNTTVTSITHSDSHVEVTFTNGACVKADYAVTTFSIGVLQQNDAVTFTPTLPEWKQTAIDMFAMGIYTKIFFQFPSRFWPDDTEYFLYADPYRRGYYPIWQSLDLDGFFPGSHVFFVTVTEIESRRVERMDDADVQAEAMAVLRTMFPDIDVPEPTAFVFPRWQATPWARGSFSVWPAGTTLEMHQNLRANVGRLWFAGEHTSASYFGYKQGAWFEGRDVGNRLAGLVAKGTCVAGSSIEEGDCGEMVHYEVLHGTTEEDEYDIKNGWDGTSFQTNGLEGEEV